MLLPQELKKYQFSRAMRGYATAEVEEYIDFLVSKYETLYRENDELERKLNVALQALDEFRAREKQVAALETVMKETAARLLAEGEAKKKAVIADAVTEADRITAEADAHVASQKALFERMQAEVAALQDALFAAYSAHIDRIEQLTAIAAGESFGESAPAPAASLTEVSEEILPAAAEPEDVPAEESEEIPAEEEDEGAAEETEEILTEEEDDLQLRFEDVYAAIEQAQEDERATEAVSEVENRLFFSFEDDTYTDKELADTDDPYDLNDTESFAETEEVSDGLSEIDDEYEEVPLPEEDGDVPSAEDEDALLLQELHDTFVHNFDAPKGADTEKETDPDEDDIMKALAEAIGEN